ncbi:hypothetical protein M5K25_020304 [Dendrobium thyrsiflorum]|uniref:Uncharacterized protein n=1 Tax=Dendrobium thyrsiflorum TaxID=117978 RepID=A0ABD0U9J0_DENTH
MGKDVGVACRSDLEAMAGDPSVDVLGVDVIFAGNEVVPLLPMIFSSINNEGVNDVMGSEACVTNLKALSFESSNFGNVGIVGFPLPAIDVGVLFGTVVLILDISEAVDADDHASENLDVLNVNLSGNETDEGGSPVVGVNAFSGGLDASYVDPSLIPLKPSVTMMRQVSCTPTWMAMSCFNNLGGSFLRGSAYHHILFLFLFLLVLFICSRILVLLILSHQIIHVALGLSELHLIHALPSVPMQESLSPEHCSRSCKLESAEANIIESLIVKHHALISILNKLVNRESSIVWLHDDEVIRAEDLPEGPGSDRIHCARLQIHENRPRNEPSPACLIVVDIDPLELQVRIAAVLPSVVDPVLVTDHLPELRTDLVAALSALDVQNFPHLLLRRSAPWLEIGLGFKRRTDEESGEEELQKNVGQQGEIWELLSREI